MMDNIYWNVLRLCAIALSIAISVVIIVACFNAVMNMLGLR